MRILYNADDNISDLLWELVNLNDSLNPIDHHTLAHSIEGLAKSVKMEICFIAVISLEIRSNGYK